MSMTEDEAIELLSSFYEMDEMYAAAQTAIQALEIVNKITKIVRIEQQATSCEHTKLKSFEMIEKIIENYQSQS